MGATAAAFENNSTLSNTALIQQMDSYLERTGKSINAAAGEMGIARPTLSRVLNGSYDTKKGDVFNTIRHYLQENDPKGSVLTPFKAAPAKKIDFFESTDAKSIVGVCNACQENARLGMIVGNTGYGKTHALQHYANNMPKVKYITCDEIMGNRDFVKSIEKVLGIPFTSKSSWERTEGIRDYFNVNPGYLLIIDEADKLITKYASRKMEIVRGIYDQSKVGIVLAGEPKLRSLVEIYLPRMENRIDFHQELNGLTSAEVAKYLKDYEIEPDALEELKQRGSLMKKSCFRLLDRTLDNVIRILSKRGQRLITLEIIEQASAMMAL